MVANFLDPLFRWRFESWGNEPWVTKYVVSLSAGHFLLPGLRFLVWGTKEWNQKNIFIVPSGTTSFDGRKRNPSVSAGPVPWPHYWRWSLRPPGNPHFGSGVSLPLCGRTFQVWPFPARWRQGFLSRPLRARVPKKRGWACTTDFELVLWEGCLRPDRATSSSTFLGKPSLWLTGKTG